MRNTFLIAKREYLERVRSKSFLIMTILIPVLMAGLMIGPGLLTMRLMKQGAKHFVVVTSRQSVGEAIKKQLAESQERQSKKVEEGKRSSLQRGSIAPSQATVDVDTNTSAEERAALTESVRKT